MPLNANLMDGPHNFANLHTLYPCADPALNVAHLKSLQLNSGVNFTQVQGDNKVAFCNLLPCSMVNPCASDGGPGLSYTQDTNLLVMRITYNRASNDSIPAYYLPWKKDHVMRMKLKPSRKHGAQEHGATLEPNLFVTAALQGCTVAICGSPTEPVVYHMNASSVVGPNNEAFGRSDQEFDIAAQAKIGHMQTLFQDAKTQFPKEGKRVGTIRVPLLMSTTASAKVTDYMLAGGKSGLNLILRDFYVRRFNPALTRTNQPKLSVMQFGTVFGVRASGEWKFYRQTRTRVEYCPRGSENWIKTWVDPVCVRYWP